MNRRYLDDETKRKFKKLSRFDDESKHVTEKEPNIPEFEDEEILKPLPRDLYLKNTNMPMDADDLLTIKIMEMVNAARETRRYIEQTNTHLEEQTERIDELKKLNKTFEKQVRTLKSRTKKEKEF